MHTQRGPLTPLPITHQHQAKTQDKAKKYLGGLMHTYCTSHSPYLPLSLSLSPSPHNNQEPSQDTRQSQEISRGVNAYILYISLPLSTSLSLSLSLSRSLSLTDRKRTSLKPT